MVGNPLIADATVQPGGILVITGKGYGATNLVALDRTERRWWSTDPGAARATLSSSSIAASSASPTAARRNASGGSRSAIRADYFAANLTQTGNLNTQAQGGAQQK